VVQLVWCDRGLCAVLVRGRGLMMAVQCKNGRIVVCTLLICDVLVSDCVLVCGSQAVKYSAWYGRQSRYVACNQ
jgi:hypothetical protein